MKNMLKTRQRELILIAVIFLIGMIVSVINPAFMTLSNIANVLNNYSVMGIMAVGMMIIIITGNIDVSVGAQFAATGMVTGALVYIWNGEHVFLIILVSITVGILLGCINGFFVAKLNIPAIIVSLATLSIIRGTLIIVSNGQWIPQLSGPFTKIANFKIGPFATPVYIWILVTVLAFFILYKTRIGRSVLAIGGNKNSAIRIGINKFKVYMFSFAFMGALSALAAGLTVSRLGIAQPNAGMGMEMKLIAAAVIGGTLFQGGVASVLGTFLGVVLFAVLENALVLTHVPVYWQSLATGLVLLIAIISSAKKLTARKKATTLEEGK